jgi:hypothetical protein
MKKKTGFFFALFFIVIFVSQNGLANIEFIEKKTDGRVRIKGRFEQFMMWGWHLRHDHIGRTNGEGGPSTRPEKNYRNSNLVLNMSLFTIEGLFKLVDNDDLVINLQTYLRWYYESSPDLDSRTHRMWNHDYLHRAYQTNRFQQDDWVNEAYLDVYKGPFNIRIGKQIVFWSEVEMVRTVDRINAIDVRYSTPGIEPWDELKLGLWMIRAFYNSDLPGNLIFETIFTLDHERNRTPFEGSWMGLSPGTPIHKDHRYNSHRPGGIKQANDNAWDDAKPAFTWSTYKLAFRIRGNSELFLFDNPYIIDWTLSYINTLDDSPVAYSDILAEFNGKLALSRVQGVPMNRLPQLRDYPRMWVFKRYELFGASVQTYVPPIRGVIRGEVSYEKGRHYNHCPRGAPDALPEGNDYIVERDHFGYGVTYDIPIALPFNDSPFYTRYGIRRMADVSIGLFQGWHLGNVTRIRQEFGYNQRSDTNVTLMIRHGIRHNEFIPVIRALYNTRNSGYVAPTVLWMPGKHFRYEFGAIWMYAKNPRDTMGATGETRDFSYFKIRYEY